MKLQSISITQDVMYRLTNIADGVFVIANTENAPIESIKALFIHHSNTTLTFAGNSLSPYTAFTLFVQQGMVSELCDLKVESDMDADYRLLTPKEFGQLCEYVLKDRLVRYPEDRTNRKIKGLIQDELTFTYNLIGQHIGVRQTLEDLHSLLKDSTIADQIKNWATSPHRRKGDVCKVPQLKKLGVTLKYHSDMYAAGAGLSIHEYRYYFDIASVDGLPDISTSYQQMLKYITYDINRLSN